jgi:hypothetical protein
VPFFERRIEAWCELTQPLTNESVIVTAMVKQAVTPWRVRGQDQPMKVTLVERLVERMICNQNKGNREGSQKKAGNEEWKQVTSKDVNL